MIDKKLLQIIKTTFRLNWKGVHGLSHWARVRVNGLLIAQQNGANQRVIELFAFLHDVKREAEFNDPEHGERAARFIENLSNDLLAINDQEKQLLCYACEYHSKGLVEGDLTVRSCWDADRLDLGRGGQRPDTKKLCTDIAKRASFFEKAYQRAIYQHISKSVPATVQTWKPAL
ncbi:MAG: hypothetical protein KZQ83_05835 [gamma proteobacterium symbiont of Taylorina sp.]|nr:hypothetical protein [gamma proteobacterium symbiont of Taylorina sp.]